MLKQMIPKIEIPFSEGATSMIPEKKDQIWTKKN